MRVLFFMLTCLCCLSQDVVDVALYVPLTSNQIFALGPKLWLMADVGVYTNGTTIPDNGGTVQTWTDISGNGNSVTQPDASSRPKYWTNYANGLPSVDFGRSFTVMLTNTLAASINPPSTAFVTCYLSNVSGSPYMFSTFGQTWPACWFDTSLVHLNNQLQAPTQLQSFQQITLVFSTNTLATGYLTNSLMFVQAKKKACGFASTSCTIPTGLAIGAHRQINSGFKGTIQEIIWFDRILNEHHRIGIELYMKVKWGLQYAM